MAVIGQILQGKALASALGRRLIAHQVEPRLGWRQSPSSPSLYILDWRCIYIVYVQLAASRQNSVKDTDTQSQLAPSSNAHPTVIQHF